MPTIRNVSPLGDLEVVVLRCVVGAGQTIDVTDEQAEALLAQPDNFAPVKGQTPITTETEA